MKKVIRTGFNKINHDIDFNPQKIINGKKLAEVHVKRVEEVEEVDHFTVVKCSVIRQTNTTETPYEVRLELDAARNIMRRCCTCVSQAAGKCKHIYALIHYVNSDRSESSTSAEQGWGKPSASQLAKEEYSKPLIVTDEFKFNLSYGPLYEAKLSDLSNINCSYRQILKIEEDEAVKIYARIFVRDLCDNAIEKYSNILCTMLIAQLVKTSKKNVIPCDINITDSVLYEYYYKNIKLSELQIGNLCLNTKNQSHCTEWHSARQLRISASRKAHLIKRRTKKDFESLACDLIYSNIPKTKAMEYGVKNEKKALREYESKYNAHVMCIGLFVKPSQSWLCASADGIVIKNGEPMKLLEIKCPATCASKPIFDEKSNKLNVKYLQIDDNKVYLRKSDIYYTQCQVSMYVVGLDFCDLYVWSPKGSTLVTVKKDCEFLVSIIPQLKSFFFKYYLKFLVNNNTENI